MILYRLAKIEDLPAIQTFTDYWLSGRGFYKGEPGAVNDCFVSTGQHKGYLRLSTVLLAYDNDTLVGWSVKHHTGALIHMLVASPHRGKGIGSEMLRILNPPLVRSKLDQSTGDPTPFYAKHGYTPIRTENSRPSFHVPKKRGAPQKNIVVLRRNTT